MRFYNQIITLFGYKRTWKPNYTWNLWENQKGWGWNLNFVGDKHNRIIGHLPNRYQLKQDQEMRVRMQSGKVGRFRIGKVTYFSDPKDMLAFDVEWFGYE